MKVISFLKILASPLVAEAKKKKGVATLICVFIFFIFSTLGLSLILFSQVYLKFSAFKKHSTFLDYSSENGIKQGFKHLLSSLSPLSSPSLLSPEKNDDLKKEANASGQKMIEGVLGQNLPLVIEGSWREQIWKSSVDFSLERMLDKEDYFLTIHRVMIDSEGKVKNFKPGRKSTLLAYLEIAAGHIPLPFFPLLIEKKLDQSKKEEFMEKNRISFLPSQENQIQLQISFSEKELLPEEATSLLSKALKINIFYPQNLSPLRLRTLLGLEGTDKPVPEGVYLIKDDLGLGGIFVQGDLEEMVTAIEDGFQILSFRNSAGCWMLRFNPSKSKTYFTTPGESFSYDFIPLGIIIVNGKINSLGGGVVGPSGQAHLVKDREIPSILQGVNLTIISSERITLSSHLIQQGIRWQEGAPYLKESNSQLIIFATGRDFFSNKKSDGEIVIGQDSPQEIKIQAHLTASGKGLAIEGERKAVHIMGSLQVSDYISNENTLKIAFDERVLEEDYSSLATPKTKSPVLYLPLLKVLEWKEF